MISDEIWNLPGPRRFLAGIADQLLAGSCVVLAAARYQLPALVLQVRGELRRLERRADTVEGTGAPLDALIACVPANESISSPYELIAASGSRTFVVTVKDRAAFEEWWVVLRRFHQHVLKMDAQTRPTIVVVSEWVGEAYTEEVALKIRRWKNAWGEIDSFALGGLFLDTSGPLSPVSRIIAHSIARLSLWDVELAKDLADRPVEVLKNPVNLLIRTGQRRGWKPDMAADDHDGSTGYENGQRVIHSSLLAIRLEPADVLKGGREELWRRRWQGQAVVLLPWIEEQRQKLIKHVARFVRAPAGEVEIMEIGPLAFELARSTAPYSDKRKSALLREARNRLAHGMILTQPELTEVVGLFEEKNTGTSI